MPRNILAKQVDLKGSKSKSSSKIIITDSYEKQLCKIEDFIYKSAEGNLAAVKWFLDHHDQVLNFIKHNPQTPPVNPLTGDQSWPFANGRYRLFYKYFRRNIYLFDLIDNRMNNLNHSLNSIVTYLED